VEGCKELAMRLGGFIVLGIHALLFLPLSAPGSASSQDSSDGTARQNGDNYHRDPAGGWPAPPYTACDGALWGTPACTDHWHRGDHCSIEICSGQDKPESTEERKPAILLVDTTFNALHGTCGCGVPAQPELCEPWDPAAAGSCPLFPHRVCSRLIRPRPAPCLYERLLAARCSQVRAGQRPPPSRLGGPGPRVAR
jgi:hypothetical protein